MKNEPLGNTESGMQEKSGTSLGAKSENQGGKDSRKFQGEKNVCGAKSRKS